MNRSFSLLSLSESVCSFVDLMMKRNKIKSYIHLLSECQFLSGAYKIKRKIMKQHSRKKKTATKDQLFPYPVCRNGQNKNGKRKTPMCTRITSRLPVLFSSFHATCFEICCGWQFRIAYSSVASLISFLNSFEE